MSIVSEIVARLEAEAVPPLVAVEGVAELAALDRFPARHQCPRAFVVPVSERGQTPALRVGATRQRIGHTVAVALFLYTDRAGEAAIAALETQRQAVRTALFGWQPASAVLPLTVSGGRLIDFADRVVQWEDRYQTEAIEDRR